MKADASRPTRLVAVFPGFGVGGAQVRYAALANRFASTCQHVILALNGDTACREKLDPGVAAHFPAANHRKGNVAAALWHAARILRGLEPDLVVTSNWGAIEWAMAAKLSGFRHVHTEDGFGPEERTRQLPRRVLTRRLALRHSAVVLPSRTLLGIATDIWRLPARRLHYIPNGIDLARFAAATSLSLATGEGPVIGTIAALRPEKNIDRLLEAFALFRRQREARLVIVGDGPERPGLEARAAALGIASDTLFAGHSTQAESWLASFDVFALSSDTEQMPISLLEAMASGLPVISTDVGDVRDMLAPQNAPYVTALRADAMAAALKAMLAGDVGAIGQANRVKAVAEFGQETMFQEWAKLFGVSL
jgi:glycosyltransferase involved in cell wall biosynthesis